MKVAFVHPDLGLGGAERLVVDAMVEAERHGHDVHVFTTYYNPKRCFQETKQFDVNVAGNWFPRSIFGKMHALCAFIRCIILALYVIFQQPLKFEVIFVDQVSIVIPLFKWFTKSRVLFYCHFPDLLLAQRGSRLRRAYRFLLDWVEEATTGQADCLVVNSKFTQGVFRSTFTRLTARGVQPAVLYPAVLLPNDAELSSATKSWSLQLGDDLVDFVCGAGCLFLSINRFERKKGLALALQALKELLEQVPGCNARLIMAGGYDARVRENVEHLAELQRLVAQLHLEQHVCFLPSFTDMQRQLLLAACAAVVYTPQHEHFGIVPLEAMAAGKPVVACNSGGPTESVLHQQTGLLCEPTPAAFRQALETMMDPTTAARMGKAARKHVQAMFSRSAFGDKLHEYLVATAKKSIPMKPLT